MSNALPRVNAGATASGDLHLEIVFAHDADDEPDAVELTVPVSVVWGRDDQRPRAVVVESATIEWSEAECALDASGSLAHEALANRGASWWPADSVLIDTWEACGGAEALRDWQRECAADAAEE